MIPKYTTAEEFLAEMDQAKSMTVDEIIAEENFRQSENAAEGERFFNGCLAELGVTQPTENEFEIRNALQDRGSVEERARWRQSRRLAKARQS